MLVEAGREPDRSRSLSAQVLRFTPSRGPHVQRGRRPHEVLTPFSPAPGLEPLTVVIDAHLIDGLDDGDLHSPAVFLGGLLSHDMVRLLRYADEGPPADRPRTSEHAPDAVRGWAVVRGYQPDVHMWSVVVDDGKTVMETGFGGDFPDAAERDPNDSIYSDLDRSDAAARRRADVIAAQAAAAAKADVFITARPYLFSVGWEVAYGLLVATPTQALPLVSLYLRAQGEFIDWRSLDGTGTSTINRGLFYQRSVSRLSRVSLERSSYLLSGRGRAMQTRSDSRRRSLAGSSRRSSRGMRCTGRSTHHKTGMLHLRCSPRLTLPCSRSWAPSMCRPGWRTTCSASEAANTTLAGTATNGASK